MYSKILVSFLIVILVIAGSRRTNGSPVSVQSSLIYKPSIAELTVPFRENPKILLINFPGKSVVLNLLNGHSSASNYLVHLARQAGNSDAGSFTVEAPKGHGVMAVIQRLHLRRISDTSSLLQVVNNCKDYLLFEGQNGEQTIPICGNLERGDRSFYPPDLHGPKFFNSPNGRIKVTFRNLFDYGNELVTTENDTEKHEDSKEVLTVEVSFTAYSNCLTPADLVGKFQCTMGQCIEDQLVCDDIENCTPGENQRYFGVDEKNCSRSFAEVDPDHGQGHEHLSPVMVDDVIEDPYQNDSDTHYTNRPLSMTNIIILVIILMFLTVCGYFWSWLSHVCCVLKGVFRSAEVGVEQHSMSSNSNQMYTATPPRLPVAYYVPAVVLRATSTSASGNNNDNSNHNSCDTKIRTNDSDAPPPAYEMLFPSPKS